jgi:hypothetical protein
MTTTSSLVNAGRLLQPKISFSPWTADPVLDKKIAPSGVI